MRQQKPSSLPNFRQLFSGVDSAPINAVPVTLHSAFVQGSLEPELSEEQLQTSLWLMPPSRNFSSESGNLSVLEGRVEITRGMSK